MRKLILVLIAFAVILVGGGAAFLASWDVPPPTQTMETVVPTDRFAR